MGVMRRLKDVAATAYKAIEDSAEMPPEKLAKLTPAQREHYEMWQARAEQARAGGPVTDGRLVGKALLGPAGDVLHGLVKAPERPERIKHPDEWERVMRAERAPRDAAREPYLAATRPPLRISRVATRGKTQTEEVGEHLAASGLAARPDLVYGLYRVPDRIRPSAGKEGSRVVEWDIVHAATEPLARAEPPADIFFDAEATWVARRIGEPSVLDEDLALAYLVQAGIGPEQTLGVARHVTIDPHGGDGEGSSSRMTGRVRGVHAFHPRTVGGAVAHELAAAAPLTLPPQPPEGIRLELLNWDAVAQAVHPVRQQRPLLPSPFPYLPLTPQELLRAYVEIVGIAPQDSYSVQVTYNGPLNLMTRTSTRAGIQRTTGGDEMPCADGKDRVRMHGGEHIVLAYRDSPVYAQGRQRWAAYQSDVLQAELARGIHVRGPLPARDYLDGRLKKTFNRVVDVVDFFDPDSSNEPSFDPPRYCWPPAGV